MSHAVGVVGAALHAPAVLGELSAHPELRLAGWGTTGGVAPDAQRPPAGLDAFVPWTEVVRDPRLAAVLVLDGAYAPDAASAAADAGSLVLCPSHTRHTHAVAHAVETVAGGRLGELHSAYVALRGAEDVTDVDTLLWETLDVVVALCPGGFERVHAVSGPGHTTAIVAFAGGPVATVEASTVGCPPGTHPTAEIELVGAEGMLRAVPHATAVHVTDHAGTVLRPFGPDPIRSILTDLSDVLRDPTRRPRETTRLDRLLTLRETVTTRDDLSTWTT